MELDKKIEKDLLEMKEKIHKIKLSPQFKNELKKNLDKYYKED